MSDIIQARHYTVGRTERVRLLVLHTTEGPCIHGAARNIAKWFAGSNAPEASAHFVVGPDEVLQCVSEDDTAWHAPPVNEYSIGVEHTAFAAFTADEWMGTGQQAMLARSAALVAFLCKWHSIPIVAVDVAGLLAGESGITTHCAVSKAFHKTDHTDPGPAFPMAAYLAMLSRAPDVAPPG